MKLAPVISGDPANFRASLRTPFTESNVEWRGPGGSRDLALNQTRWDLHCYFYLWENPETLRLEHTLSLFHTDDRYVSRGRGSTFDDGLRQARLRCLALANGMRIQRATELGIPLAPSRDELEDELDAELVFADETPLWDGNTGAWERAPTKVDLERPSYANTMTRYWADRIQNSWQQNMFMGDWAPTPAPIYGEYRLNNVYRGVIDRINPEEFARAFAPSPSEEFPELKVFAQSLASVVKALPDMVVRGSLLDLDDGPRRSSDDVNDDDGTEIRGANIWEEIALTRDREGDN